MKKRIAVALLWFYTGWYTWATIAAFAGLPELWGPVLGAAAAALFAGDPLYRIWIRAPERAEVNDATATVGARQTT